MKTDIVRIAKIDSYGWELGMILVHLPGGGVLVHSPTWLGDDTIARVLAVGEPRILFAPNHFHHLSLGRFRSAWPEAKLVAGRAALPRLRKRGHSSVSEVDAATDLLPVGARWLECEGAKSGETLLALADRTWIAGDAFFNIERPVTGIVGTGLRMLKTVPGLSIGQTFNWLALSNRPAYREWVLSAIERDRPSRLWMSHGETVEGEDLPERLAELVKARV
jgi:hypothetical protein